jgi:hypothetical protein
MGGVSCKKEKPAAGVWGCKKTREVERRFRVWFGVGLGPDGGMPTGPLGLVGWGGCFPFFFINSFLLFIFPVCLQNHFK